ncbi:hypothetical protein RM533_12410 [Croceicoccus sp. F390]|uniref:Polysaccharide biosynthesis protein n=1 Tax=Croceicoccus esteveae TaxID=3075597 RepID=A0ABU2ZK42_9SPHN|nr:hypothetical protein [Croceicoccus sp. F390]MDT0576970.1 hypothetical protein [Croceicoccus sp. F390]
MSDFSFFPNRLVRIRQAARAPMVLSAGMFAASGALFAIGTLLLARTMPIEAFGRFALGVALFNLFSLVAPAGLDQLVLRMRLAVGWRLAGLIAASGVALGSLVAVVTFWSGGLLAAEAAMTMAAIAAGGMSVMVAGVLRASGRTASAVPYTTGANWIILAIGLVGLVVPFSSALAPLALFAAGNLLRALIGWRMLLRERQPEHTGAPVDWPQAAALVGIATVGTAMLQMERLLIPIVLDLTDLALFAVLSSTVMFPFRLLNQAAGFALTPLLANEPDPQRRRALVHKEALIVTALAAVAAGCAVALAPPIVGWITSDAYRITGPLVLAGCANGMVKLLYAVTRSVVTACGTRAQIGRLNGLGLLWILLATLGGATGATFGLTGLLLGVAAGGLLTVLPLWVLARKTLLA